jgi:hypothetical protein
MLYLAFPREEYPAAALIVLACALYAPHVPAFLSRRGWLVPPVLAVASLSLLTLALVLGKDSRDPVNRLTYAANLDKSSAVLFSREPGGDRRFSQFITTGPQDLSIAEQLPQWYGTQAIAGKKALGGPAPLATSTGPEVALIEEIKTGETQRRVFLLRSARSAPELAARWRASGVIIAMTIAVVGSDGQSPGMLNQGANWVQRTAPSEVRLQPDGQATLFVTGLGEFALRIAIETRQGGPLHIEAVDRSYDLPELFHRERSSTGRSLPGEETIAMRSFVF